MASTVRRANTYYKDAKRKAYRIVGANVGFHSEDHMFTKVSEQIAEALCEADKARQRAKFESDEQLKLKSFEMEKRWLALVERLRFVERVNRLHR